MEDRFAEERAKLLDAFVGDMVSKCSCVEGQRLAPHVECVAAWDGWKAMSAGPRVQAGHE